MTTILGYVLELFKFLFVEYEAGQSGAVIAFANAVIGNELLILPIVIMLVGLVVGIFARVVNSVRG